MNLFENISFLCGNCGTENLKKSMQKFFVLANDIKDSLEENSHMFNDYLFTIFKSLDAIEISMATDRAESLCSEVISVCRTVLSKGENEKIQSPFYSKAVDLIKNSPVIHDKYDTKIYFYAANILIDNIENISKDFISDVRNKILSKVNYETVNKSYKNIVKIVGKDRINYLNDLLYENFIVSPIIMIFMQSIIQKIVNMMVYEDPVMKNKVFELMMK